MTWRVMQTDQGDNGLDIAIVDETGKAVGWAYNNSDAKIMASSPRLYDELRDFFIQKRCGCGHPSCKNCMNDKDIEKVLFQATGEKF